MTVKCDCGEIISTRAMYSGEVVTCPQCWAIHIVPVVLNAYGSPIIESDSQDLTSTKAAREEPLIPPEVDITPSKPAQHQPVRETVHSVPIVKSPTIPPAPSKAEKEPSKISMECECGQKITTSSKNAGKKLKCPQCRITLTVLDDSKDKPTPHESTLNESNESKEISFVIECYCGHQLSISKKNDGRKKIYCCPSCNKFHEVRHPIKEGYRQIAKEPIIDRSTLVKRWLTGGLAAIAIIAIIMWQNTPSKEIVEFRANESLQEANNEALAWLESNNNDDGVTIEQNLVTALENENASKTDAAKQTLAKVKERIAENKPEALIANNPEDSLFIDVLLFICGVIVICVVIPVLASSIECHVKGNRNSASTNAQGGFISSLNDYANGLLYIVAFCAILFGLFIYLFDGGSSSSTYTGSRDDEINDIITAKEYVRSQLNYPDTADFHELKTEVTPTHIKLVVTAKNAFGVPSTHTFNVPRD